MVSSRTKGEENASKKRKIHCAECKKSCKGQAVRLQDKYFHVKCFRCVECKKQLAAGGFYAKEEKYYCADDYQKLFGTQCFACSKYVEGEVVTALGNTYHQECFHCTKCRSKFGPGDKVTFNGKDYLCNKCLEQFEASKSTPVKSPTRTSGVSPSRIRDKENAAPIPQKGVLATSTPAKTEQLVIDGYLSSPVSDMSESSADSKVLTPRGQPNGPGAHSYLGFSPISAVSSVDSSPPTSASSPPIQNGSAHSRTQSYPSPILKKTAPPTPSVHVYSDSEDRHSHSFREFSDNEVFVEEFLGPREKRLDTTGDYYGDYSASDTETAEHRERLSPMQHIMQYRSPSPHSTISRSSHKSRESGGSYDPRFEVDFGRFYNQSYLKHPKHEKEFRKTPVNPPTSKPKSPHFHRPENFSYQQVRRDFMKPLSKDASMMSALGDHRYIAKKKQLEDVIPIGKDEMIRLARYPDGQKPEGERRPAIEREDWPGPPEPAVAFPELLREHPLGQGRSKSEDELAREEKPAPVDPKIKRDIEMLAKMPDSGVGKVFMKELEKVKSESPNLDPRSASRVPAADREPAYKTRYVSPIFASPSRDLDYRPRLHSMDDLLMGMKYRTSTLPISNFPVPKPGYGMRAKNIPGRGRNAGYVRYDGYMSEPEYRAGGYSGYVSEPDYRSHRQDSTDGMDRRSYHTSQSSVEEYDPETGLRKSKFRSSGLSDSYHTYLAFRSSVPSMLRPEEPPQIFPYEQLRTSNYKLPPNVDKTKLERHLSKEEFESIFHMTREDFYRLAEFKRNDLKRRVDLF